MRLIRPVLHWLFGLVNDLALNHRPQHLGLADLVNGNREQVSVQDHKVRKFSCLNGSEVLIGEG